jgi:transposase InsO family protein
MTGSNHDAHARFRFSVIGPLLSAPPRQGELRAALEDLAVRSWKHPITGEATRYGFSTIERWYYTARDAQNPVDVLRRAVRRDTGRWRSISAAFEQAARAQYSSDPDWTRQLHHDNLCVAVENEPSLGPLPSYQSFVRFMNAVGLTRKRRPGAERPGQARARQRLEEREVRSYEVDHVGALWHLDFHTSKNVAVLTSDGTWRKPDLFAAMDDHSRLCCHAQFYFSETTEDLVHGFSQALLKRDLPRELMSDNGSAMTSGEFTQGLGRLSIHHQTTLSDSPYQNGKQEYFWSVVEGRLMAMLRRIPDLTLDKLNLYLQAWVEGEYNRRHHSEIGTTPLDRFQNGPDVSRPSPSLEGLRDVFRLQVTRKQRKSDGTFSLDATRFELPSRYRHLSHLCLRYARWDLGYVHLVDDRANKLLARVFPLDRSRNATGERRRLQRSATGESQAAVTSDELPPLMKKLLEDYAATGLPPSYLPKIKGSRDGNNDNHSTTDQERTI